MITLSSYIYSLATKLASYQIKDIPEIFSLFSNFIDSAPESYFIPLKSANLQDAHFQDVPLYLSNSGIKALKSKLHNYSDIIHSGLTFTPNFLYVLGQFLTIVVTKIDKLQIDSPEKFEIIKPVVNKLYKIWNSRNHMNAISLFNTYTGKNPDTVKSDLSSKLHNSYNLVQKIKWFLETKKNIIPCSILHYPYTTLIYFNRFTNFLVIDNTCLKLSRTRYMTFKPYIPSQTCLNLFQIEFWS